MGRSLPLEIENNSVGEAYRAYRGANPHSRSNPSPNDPLFISGNTLAPNRDKFYKYFPLIVGRSSKALYQLLLVIYSHPLRSARFLRECTLSNSTTTLKNLLILVDMGYIQIENKPRKIIPFDAYTIDKVYRITTKGVKALSAITGY